MLSRTQKVMLFFVRGLVKAYLGWGIYAKWSKVHRFLFDRKWKDVYVPHFNNLWDVALKMRTFKWKRDGISELWDAVCTPQKVQAVGFDLTSPHGNDCDEEAIWLTNVIDNSLPFRGDGYVEQRVIGASFFTVTWYEPATNHFSGHNVCLLNCTDGFRYMDYHEPSDPCRTIDEVVQTIVDKYAGWDSSGHGTRDAVVLCWCLSTKDLKPYMVG